MARRYAAWSAPPQVDLGLSAWRTSGLNPATPGVGCAKTLGVDVSETRFAKSGDVHIAYKVIGEGPIDVVFVAGLEYQTMEALEFPLLMEEARAFVAGVGPFMRLIRFDKRGTGSSDRVFGVPS